MTIRYGLIGSGMMGQEHIRNINLLDDTIVTAVMDPDDDMRELSVKTSGGTARPFDNLGELLSADLCDAYVIVAPNDTHHRIMLDVLPCNKPVLCEKPLCTTTEHCQDVMQLATQHDAPVWVAMEYRYMPPVQSLLKEVSNGRAGALQMMAIREHRFPFLEKVEDWNRFNIRTGGTLVEKCCHFWDLMRLVLQSNPVRVYASAGADVNHRDESYNGRTPDIIDNAFVVVDFENGTRGMLDLCMFAEGSTWQEVISVTGPDARVEARIPGPARFSASGLERTSQIEISERISKQVITEDVEVDEAVLAAGDHHGSTFYQHQAFFDLVRSGKGKPDVSLEDGLWSVLVGECAEQSARSGQAVELTPRAVSCGLLPEKV